MNNPVTHIPERFRKTIYGIFAFVGVTIGAFQVGFSAAGAEQPVWVNVSMAIYVFVGGAIGFTAASNTPAQDGGHVAR